MALIAGAALSSAGATFQGVFRNPLAEPYILGISAGAGVGATIAIIWKPLTALGIYSLPLLAFVGALFAAFLVYRLATFSGQTSGVSLLLSGVAVGSTFTAVMSAMMIATEPDLHTVFVWLMGGLTTSTWSKVAVAGPMVAAGFVYMFFMARRMNLLLMGEETGLGARRRCRRTRRNLLIVASLTTAAAVAFTGLIGFVGLMVPHMMSLLIGPDHRHLLPATAIFGALFLLAADTVARTAFAPARYPWASSPRSWGGRSSSTSCARAGGSDVPRRTRSHAGARRRAARPPLGLSTSAVLEVGSGPSDLGPVTSPSARSSACWDRTARARPRCCAP